jgi:NADPH2:quinone reductase
MRAVLCNDFTGPADLTIGELAAPDCGDDEVLIDVHAASVSFMDYLIVTGGYQMRPPTPFAPGTDAAGTVARVGKDVTSFKPGDRVVGANWVGAYAEQMAVKQWRCVRLPDNLEFAPASILLHNYGTAYYALVNRARLASGETLFVTGASGGVGLAVIDMAKALGARVIAGVGSPGKEDLLRQNGADEVIHYGNEDLRDRIKELTGGNGIDVCFDMIGGEVFDVMTRVMAWDGRLMPIGFTSGTIPQVPMNLPLLKGYSIVGVFTGAWQEKFRDESVAMNEILVTWLADGRLHPYVGRILPMEQAAEAMHAIADRKVRGRAVLKIR